MSVRRPRPRPLGRGAPRPVSAYDLFLFVLPLPALAGVAGGGGLLRWGGALVSLALLLYGLFVVPPGASGRSE